MEDQAKSLGERVKSARRGALMTQEILATAAGVSGRTVARVEAGEEASVETLRCLGAVLGIDLTSPDAQAGTLPALSDRWADDGVLPRRTEVFGSGLSSFLGGLSSFVDGRERMSRELVNGAMVAALSLDGNKTAVAAALRGVVQQARVPKFSSNKGTEGDNAFSFVAGGRDAGARMLAWLSRQKDVGLVDIVTVDRHVRATYGDVGHDPSPGNVLIFYALFVLATDFVVWSAGFGGWGVWAGIATLAVLLILRQRAFRTCEAARAVSTARACLVMGMPAATALRVAGDAANAGRVRHHLLALSAACEVPPPRREDALRAAIPVFFPQIQELAKEMLDAHVAGRNPNPLRDVVAPTTGSPAGFGNDTRTALA